MPDYSQSKVYKLVSNFTNEIYIGSTCSTLTKRKNQHKASYNSWLNGRGHYLTSFELYKLGPVEIILIETCACNSKDELHSRERHHIELNECLNKVIPGRSDQEYYQSNRDNLIAKRKQYNQSNHEAITIWKTTQIICDICGADSTNSHISRHKKTAKCRQIKAQNEYNQLHEFILS